MEDYAKKIYEILDMIEITDENQSEILEVQQLVQDGAYDAALMKLKQMNLKSKGKLLKKAEETEEIKKSEKVKTEEINKYPKELSNQELEEVFIGLLLSNPQSISMYYYLYNDCYFEDEKLYNIYKSILFTEGEKYASEQAKKDFNFSKDTVESYNLKAKLKEKVEEKKYNFEKTYTELKKLFILRKSFSVMPIKELKDKIIEITEYDLYDKMTPEEVESAVNQVTITNKFKRAILNTDTTDFLVRGENILTNGISLPFKILTEVFKGIRKGETMSFAMPSNSGKSRFTIDLSAYISFIHKKKVLIISNEMSEEKMKLCLITTIINNPEIQKIHGQKLSITEGELLALKFRPDKDKKVEVDEDGYIKREEKETQKEYVNKLAENSSDFNKVILATEWLNKQINNSIYFINITDHTNDELRKVIMNYYYKEQIEYIFYDTLKADIENIGNAEEVKKTATIFSNLAQEFNMFIGSTLQLKDSNTLPINMDVNELSASKTVKEVLDGLCMFKQINRETYDKYEYSLNEVDTKFYDLKAYKDPDVRYYACVIDKNRAGAKPKLLFKINLAYNIWEEEGYLRMKQNVNL
jgi:replicative DNA helicase